MIFYLSHNGNEVKVDVERLADGRFAVRFPEGETCVEMTRGHGLTHSMIDGEGEQYEMTLREETDGRVRVGWGSEEMIISVLTELESRAQKTVKKRDENSGWELESSLPGKIKTILVKEGDPVEAGTPLIIMEAMKMENELRAERGGVVERIEVKEGDTVETGSLLMTAGPPRS